MAKQPVNPPSDPQALEAARLRAAHDLLDERPSPKVRAAVLRAAARGPGVDPAGAGAPAPATRRWFGWTPVAAGATAAAAILAVGVSLHVEREHPLEEQRGAPAAVSSPSAPAGAAPVPRTPAAPATVLDAARSGAAGAAAGNRARESASLQAPRSARFSDARAAPPAPAAALAAPAPSADEWLGRIIGLRRAGRRAEAEQELARFRAAYPQATVPAEALE